ncbi:MAG TPA: hypothetical protein VJS92_04520 [Candidatus Polarisedimenticolaceae bacterium]|nr:hypothetical protein [Candidatus Polarisedimenticolaceae bacterium]
MAAWGSCLLLAWLRSAAAADWLYYLEADGAYRVSLVDRHVEALVEFPSGLRPSRPEDVKVAAGKVVWAVQHGPARLLVAWDGQATHRLSVEPQSTVDEQAVHYEYGDDGELRRIVPEMRPVHFDDFVLSPDGSRVAWNVNLVTGLSPESSGIAHRRHRVYVAGLDGKNRELLLDQEYDVDGFMADATEERHLWQWSRTEPDWLYMTRFKGGQLKSEELGLERCNVRTRKLELLDGTIERVLALSPDETGVAYTPNDDSCCGAVNATDNTVIVKARSGGKETVVFDEWKEFGNKTIEAGDEGVGEEIVPRDARFSPDGALLALTLEHDIDGKTPRLRATVRRLDGGPARFLEDRCVLGWKDARRLVLGVCRVSSAGARTVGPALLYDVDSGREAALPARDGVVLGLDD